MRYKRPRRATVELTSLLDLLFVMIFISLIQQKPLPSKKESLPVAKEKTETKPVPKKKIKQKKKAPVVAKNYSIAATFNFYSTPSNPNLPAGSFFMQGKYHSGEGKLQLGGVSWIQRPANYDMVPLSGVINAKLGIFRGRIEFPGCQTFTLKRQEKSSGQPIAGTWVGSYRCTQGETGLRLEIE